MATRVCLRLAGDPRIYMRHDDNASFLSGTRLATVLAGDSFRFGGPLPAVGFVCNWLGAGTHLRKRRGIVKPKRAVVQLHTSCAHLQEFTWTTPEYLYSVEYRVLAQFTVQRCARSIALAQFQSSLQVPPWFQPSHQDVGLRPHPAVGRCHIACGHSAAHHRRRLGLVGRGGAYCRHLVAAYRVWSRSRGDLGPCQPVS